MLVSDLHGIKTRNIEDLSGGELQRFAIAIVCIQRADVSVFIYHPVFDYSHHFTHCNRVIRKSAFCCLTSSVLEI